MRDFPTAGPLIKSVLSTVLGPVHLAWTESGPDDKPRLAEALLSSLFARAENRTRRQTPAFRLHQGSLGRPVLTVYPDLEIPVSYSRAGGRTYAALAARGSLGLDAARAEEFEPGYPYHRAFGPDEWPEVDSICRERPRAAALLWSLKEAAVKALGTGFNLFDPLAVSPAAKGRARDGWLFTVTAGRNVISAASWPEERGWLTVAALERNLGHA